MSIYIFKKLPIVVLLYLCNIYSTYATFCPNDCSGHGTCELDGNICECWPGWNTGIPDCSLRK